MTDFCYKRDDTIIKTGNVDIKVTAIYLHSG